jgi:IS5 family transposase
MAEQLRQHPSGRICLYGPPGTGKTAYGRWLAQQLGKPLHVKRASDLISMWVGETEKNLAKAFAQAEEANALLLIDEVDTFLQNREGAQRSWEVSQVNEMLTQMESFGGVFIASTNLMAGLDSAALRRFVGIDLGRERVPDGTTLLKFRRLLETHELGQKLFATVGQALQARGLKVGTGTIVDATIIGAPSSTKNADKARDPEMHQTRKGQQWYFGMKVHIGVDSRTGLAHSAVVTAANVHDKHPLPDLLHGNEQRVYGDSAYASQKALIATKAPQAKDFTNQRIRRGGEINEAVRSKNHNKSKVRARVEHVFAVVKRLWGFAKVRYRGLAKNATRSFVALGLANIYLARTRLMG